MPLPKPAAFTVVSLVAALVVADRAKGQALVVGGGSSVRVESCHVTATVEEGVARVEVDETFRNPASRALEGVFCFRLPESAIVGDFSMWMEGKEQRGRVIDAKTGRQIYDSIVRKQRDPGLLEQTGWREFRVNVFPVPANDVVRVKLTWSDLLRDDAGLDTLTLPLPNESGVVGDLRVEVAITAAAGLAALDCPSHAKAKLECSGDHATATWSGDGVVPASPFVLRMVPKRSGFTASLLADRAEGAASGWFVARVVPHWARATSDAMAETAPEIPRDLLFVVDRSGSMDGAKIQQARAALLAGLATLRPCDRFDVVSFSTDVTALGGGELLAATPKNLERARQAAAQITASGGTNIGGGLLAALKECRPDRARFAAIVFLTDGMPTVGETDPERLLATWRERSGATRLFALGVGTDVKDFLLTKLAAEGRGDARYVRDGDDLEVPLASLFAKIRTPLLLDPEVQLTSDGAQLQDLEPRRLPDLFEGRALFVAGRYTGSGPAVLHLRGRSGKREVAVDVPVDLPAVTPPRPHVAQLWAKSRVERLLDDLRVLGPNREIESEVRALGLAHQIVTPYTSFLVVEANVKTADGASGPADSVPSVDDGTPWTRVPPTLGGGGDTTPPGIPAGPPTTGGAGMRPATGGLGGRKGASEGFERWEFWWEHNKDRFLAEARAARPATAERKLAPEFRERAIETLLAALADPDPDIADAAPLALARVAGRSAPVAVTDALAKALAHPGATVREEATLALGLVGSDDALRILESLLRDPNGDALCPFAAAALGLSRDPDAVEPLLAAAREAIAASQIDLAAIALQALGLIEARSEQKEAIALFLIGLVDERTVSSVIRAQAPIALARLLGDDAAGDIEVNRMLAVGLMRSKLLPAFRSDKTDNDLRRSLAIALGRLAAIGDEDAVAVLRDAVDQSNDDQTRHFALIALAEIGARDPKPDDHLAAHAELQALFTRELTRPKRIQHQPFGALALAIEGRNRKLPAAMRAAAVDSISAGFTKTSNPSYCGAMAIALGLLDAESARPPLRKVYEQTNDQALVGSIAVGVALTGDADFADELRHRIGLRGLEPKCRVQLARALGLLGGSDATGDTLLRIVTDGATLAEAASAAQALGAIGDAHACGVLLDVAGDTTRASLQRSFAISAVGLIADPSPLPWGAAFSADSNYRAKTETLAELLDLL